MAERPKARRRRRLALLVGSAVAAAVLGAGPAGAEPARFHFVAFGDMPYNLPADFSRFENLIAAVNASGPAFAIHVGDLKGGGWPCRDAHYQRIKGYFDRVAPALVYTPGDNDWSDCDRSSAGGHDTRERLAHLRRLFFAEARSLGRAPFPVARQADADPVTGLPENLLWQHGGVTFGTVHIVGPDDNLGDDPEEFAARRASGLGWIERIFAEAEREASIAVVIAFHADMFWPFASGSAFGETRQLLARSALAFGRPVLLVHGDGHVYTVDRPLRLAGEHDAVPNVTRVEVFGDGMMHAVRVEVDPSRPAVFTVSPLWVEANRDG